MEHFEIWVTIAFSIGGGAAAGGVVVGTVRTQIRHLESEVARMREELTTAHTRIDQHLIDLSLEGMKRL